MCLPVPGLPSRPNVHSIRSRVFLHFPLIRVLILSGQSLLLSQECVWAGARRVGYRDRRRMGDLAIDEEWEIAIEASRRTDLMYCENIAEKKSPWGRQKSQNVALVAA